MCYRHSVGYSLIHTSRSHINWLVLSMLVNINVLSSVHVSKKRTNCAVGTELLFSLNTERQFHQKSGPLLTKRWLYSHRNKDLSYAGRHVKLLVARSAYNYLFNLVYMVLYVGILIREKPKKACLKCVNVQHVQKNSDRLRKQIAQSQNERNDWGRRMKNTSKNLSFCKSLSLFHKVSFRIYKPIQVSGNQSSVWLLFQSSRVELLLMRSC